MRYNLSPEFYHFAAIKLAQYKWSLLFQGIAALLLYLLLQAQITMNTPNILVWGALTILFFALQSLVFASFIFFFLRLASSENQANTWFNFYRFIEWSETILFTILLPLPLIMFSYLVL